MIVPRSERKAGGGMTKPGYMITLALDHGITVAWHEKKNKAVKINEKKIKIEEEHAEDLLNKLDGVLEDPKDHEKVRKSLGLMITVHASTPWLKFNHNSA